MGTPVIRYEFTLRDIQSPSSAYACFCNERCDNFVIAHTFNDQAEPKVVLKTSSGLLAFWPSKENEPVEHSRISSAGDSIVVAWMLSLMRLTIVDTRSRMVSGARTKNLESSR